MNKIPTLFTRDLENRKYVTDIINDECQWVLDGEGVATRKYDGTCVMLDKDGKWWSRREVKPNKPTPPDFVEVSLDEFTGKRMGWVPIRNSGFLEFFAEALGVAGKIKTFDSVDEVIDQATNDYLWEPGTYELIGPKINGNPEGVEKHELVRHADILPIRRSENAGPLTPDMIKNLIVTHSKAFGWEGVVWHHPDGRMAKLKARDLPSYYFNDPIDKDAHEVV